MKTVRLLIFAMFITVTSVAQQVREFDFATAVAEVPVSKIPEINQKHTSNNDAYAVVCGHIVDFDFTMDGDLYESVDFTIIAQHGEYELILADGYKVGQKVYLNKPITYKKFREDKHLK